MSDELIERQEQDKAYKITYLNNLMQERTFRLENLCRDVSKTQENIAKHDEDMLKITRVLQRQIDEKTDTISTYKVKLQQLEAQTKQVLVQQDTKFEFEKKEVSRKQEIQVVEQSKQIQTLVATQEQLLEFKNTRMIKKKELENEEQRYKTLLTQLVQVETQGLEDLERQKQRIQEQYTQFLDDFKKNAQSKAEKNISEIERNIQAQNQRLEDEAKLQDEELEYLERHQLEIEQSNEVFNIELQSKGLTTEEYSKRQFEKQKKIKLLKTKIDLLEKSLGQIVNDFEKERELLKFQNEQIIRDQGEELRNLSDTTRQKNTELRNLRAICQMVLDQRSDIEQFFLEAMEQVKEEKKQKLEAQMQQTQGSNVPEFLPLIKAQSKYSKNKDFELSNQQNSQSLLSRGKQINVELNDLDWEDRETVLRLLFSKMNTGEPASNWRDPHATKSQSGTSSGQAQANSDLNQGFRQDNEESEGQYGDY